MKSWAIWTVGTVRSNQLKSEELKKEGRGSVDIAVDANSGLAMVRWLQNSSVQLLLTHIAKYLVTSIK